MADPAAHQAGRPRKTKAEKKLNDDNARVVNDIGIVAQKETGLLSPTFPATCPWTVEEILAEDWLAG